jgi:hypothetical protein
MVALPVTWSPAAEPASSFEKLGEVSVRRGEVDVSEPVPHPINASAPSAIAPFATPYMLPPDLKIAHLLR